MLSKDEFVRRILDGAAPEAETETDTGFNDAMLEGFDGFDVLDDSEQATADARFAQLLLEESGFGRGEALPRSEVVLGDQKTNRFLPHRVRYWTNTTERPFHILLFDLEVKGSAILDDGFFKRSDQLEDALHRIVQDALEGFERGGEGRTADRKKGAQAETLCVVSVIDDRGDGPERQIVCFGTKCTTTDALEVFTLREEARDWDRALAEEHLGQVFERHFKRLGTGARWQDAFVSGEERKKARRLMNECIRLMPDEKQLQTAIRELLDEIAGSFGLRRKGGRGGHRLVMHALPEDHSIAVDPEYARKSGFKNPFQGLRIFDADERLIGYIVYVLDKKSEAERLRSQLAQHNHFHNVLVVYPEERGATLELWQGNEPLRGRLISGNRRSRFDGEGGVVQLLSRFFVVSRSAIGTPRRLAMELAWRAQHLKALAIDELRREETKPQDQRPLRDLFNVFNRALATLDETQFSDAYAQTITYGLLAARWLSSGQQDVRFTRKNIDALLPSTSPFLHDLFQRLVNSRFDQNLSWLLDDITSLLSRTMVAEVFQGEQDPSIHFYQDFLDAYDPQIRKDQGVYYTPDEVVSYIVRTAHTALQDDFGLPLGLADTTSWADFAKARAIEVPEGIDGDEPFVQVLDPATGTGTFLLRVIEVIHETMMAQYGERGLDEKSSQCEWVKYVRAHLLPRINGFELMMAPYIVSHLRLGLALQQTGFVFGDADRLRVFLTNTLEMHTLAQLSWIGEHVAEEAQQAERIKKDAPISVVVGNPPYEREPADDAGNHKGGWVRNGWGGWRGGRALLEDFNERTRLAGAGSHLKNVYNLYVYFWRWASWRVFDRFGAPGIVSFITASSYLRGPGFVGMREEMRRASSDIYILDLEGDQRGTRVTDNVFCITIPVCVGTLVSASSCDRESAAAANYSRVVGSRSEKLAACTSWPTLKAVPWLSVPDGWHMELLTAEASRYDSWPEMTELFPWQRSGCKTGRTWVVAEIRSLLVRRWEELLSLTGDSRVEAFKNSSTGQKAHKPPVRLPPLAGNDTAVTDLPADSKPPLIERFGSRSFDRQWIIADSRFLDRAGPTNWYVRGDNQVYLTSLLSGVLGDGPAATVSAFVPDLHHFRGSYGGKDVIPLWRDTDGKQANIARALLTALATRFGDSPTPKEVFAYTYAILANPGYVRRFEENLVVPGPRLPLTKDVGLFKQGVLHGEELLRWHTYGERFRSDDDGFELSGTAAVITQVPSSADSYPEKHKYHAKRQVLQVGDGEVGPVSEAVWNLSVSGLQVVKSWLDYRMKKGAGRKSSPLDDIRPEHWTSEMTQELLELLWVLEWSLCKYPELDAWLDEVLEGELFTADEIPAPTDAERKEPKIKRRAKQGTLLR